MLSNSSKYAIKAVLFLALNTNDNKKVMVKDISEPINVPQAYIAKLLQELSRKHIISSTRGPKGGFYLSEENKDNTVMDIINALDTEKRISACQLSLEKCDIDRPCPLHKILNPYRSNMIDSLERVCIRDLAIEVQKGNAFLPL